MKSKMSGPTYATLIDALWAAPKERPLITMWRDEDSCQEVTFGQFVGLAKRQAARFRHHGASAGDRVIWEEILRALSMDPSIEDKPEHAFHS